MFSIETRKQDVMFLKFCIGFYGGSNVAGAFSLLGEKFAFALFQFHTEGGVGGGGGRAIT